MKKFKFNEQFINDTKNQFKINGVNVQKINDTLDSLTIENSVTNHILKLSQLSGYVAALSDMNMISKRSAYFVFEWVKENMELVNRHSTGVSEIEKLKMKIDSLELELEETYFEIEKIKSALIAERRKNK